MGADFLSTGTGGSLGGPPTRFINELETTAATLNMQINLGIVSGNDFDLIPFSSMGRQMTWKYTGDSTKPVLAPLIRLPLVLQPFVERDTAWIEDFNRLVEYLPPDVRDRYIYESSLPFSERDPAYTDLDTFLGVVADFLAWSRQISAPAYTQSTAAIQTIYQALPVIFGQQFMSFAVTGLLSAESYLAAVGPNDPHFDQVVGIVRSLQAFMIELQTVQIEDLTSVAADLRSWASQLSGLAIGDGQLQVLATMVDLMALVATAKTLPVAVQPLFLALSAALVGVDESALGVISGPFSSFVNLMAGAFISPPVQDSFLTSLLEGFILLAATAKSWGTTHMSPLLFHMCLHCFLQSGLLDVWLNDIGVAAGIDEKSLQAFKDTLTAALLLFLIPKENSEAFVEEFHPYLLDAFTRLEGFSQAGQSLTILITQGKEALEKNDFAGFVQIQNEAKQLLELPETADFDTSSNQFTTFADSLWNNAVHTEEYSQTQANIGVYQG